MIITRSLVNAWRSRCQISKALDEPYRFHMVRGSKTSILTIFSKNHSQKKKKKSKFFKCSVWISMDAGRLPKIREALGKAWGSPGTWKFKEIRILFLKIIEKKNSLKLVPIRPKSKNPDALCLEKPRGIVST